MNSFPSKINLSTNSDKILNSRRFKKLCLNSTVNVTKTITVPPCDPQRSNKRPASLQCPYGRSLDGNGHETVEILIF